MEPNCKAHIIGKITIVNKGEMPSQKNQDIVISLLPTSNIIPDNAFFNISKSIPYNKTLKLEKKTQNFH